MFLFTVSFFYFLVIMLHSSGLLTIQIHVISLLYFLVLKDHVDYIYGSPISAPEDCVKYNALYVMPYVQCILFYELCFMSCIGLCAFHSIHCLICIAFCFAKLLDNFSIFYTLIIIPFFTLIFLELN